MAHAWSVPCCWPGTGGAAGGREIVVSCQNLRSEETETTLDNNKHPPSHCHHEAKREAETHITLLQYDFISSILRRYEGCQLSVELKFKQLCNASVTSWTYHVLQCNVDFIDNSILRSLDLSSCLLGHGRNEKRNLLSAKYFSLCGHLAGYRKFWDIVQQRFVRAMKSVYIPLGCIQCKSLAVLTSFHFIFFHFDKKLHSLN